MTDVNGAQAELQDQELVDLLVPPRRPRWQVGVALAGVAVVVVCILLINHSGVVSPRITVSVDNLSWEKGQASATFLVTNKGWTSAEVRGVTETIYYLDNARVVSKVPQTIDPHETRSFTVHFDVACHLSTSGDQTNEIGIRVKSPIGVPMTQVHEIDDYPGDSWAESLHSEYCKANPQP